MQSELWREHVRRHPVSVAMSAIAAASILGGLAMASLDAAPPASAQVTPRLDATAVAAQASPECESQTWPNIAPHCIGGSAPRKVRVIPTGTQAMGAEASPARTGAPAAVAPARNARSMAASPGVSAASIAPVPATAGPAQLRPVSTPIAAPPMLAEHESRQAAAAPTRAEIMAERRAERARQAEERRAEIAARRAQIRQERAQARQERIERGRQARERRLEERRRYAEQRIAERWIEREYVVPSERGGQRRVIVVGRGVFFD